MIKRSRLIATLGATVLTLGVVGIALAVDLKDPHKGTTITWDSLGNPVATNGFTVNTDTGCAALDLAPGVVFIHFVQSPTDANSGNITVDFGTDGTVGPQADLGQSNEKSKELGWDVTVTDDGDGSVTVVDATTDVDGGELKISSICAGTNTPAPSPSFQQSQADTTEAPSFQQSQADVTQCPCDTTPGLANTSHPADGAWLLVVALGVLLASVVVLTPARVKNRR